MSGFTIMIKAERACGTSQHENKPRGGLATHPSNYGGGTIHDPIMIRFCWLWIVGT
jgi:hypothetical protein